MIIDRRTFVASATSVALVPALSILPAQLSPPEMAVGRLVLMIEGWNAPGDSGDADTVWIQIGRSWRTAWR